MKKITLIITLFLLVTLSTKTIAQSQEDMQKWTVFMTPGDTHKMLAKSDGNWNEDITMWMVPNTPAQKSTATCVNKMILGGRYQESISTGAFNGMPFEGHSIVGYDNAKKILVSSWIDNFGTGIIYMEGTYDPSTKTATFKGKETDPMTGNDIDVRQTMQFIDDNTQLLTMYQTQNGQEFKSMEIKFTRKS
ncbi:MAG: DUF1579 domain-containing protein [Chitinophagaceae bacterium]